MGGLTLRLACFFLFDLAQEGRRLKLELCAALFQCGALVRRSLSLVRQFGPLALKRVALSVKFTALSFELLLARCELRVEQSSCGFPVIALLLEGFGRSGRLGAW